MPSDVFWDIGANVGVFSLYAARRRGVRVLAFEPSADNYMVLCKNVEINDLGDWIVPYCIALAGNTELGVLNSPRAKWEQRCISLEAEGKLRAIGMAETTTFAQGMVGFTIDDFIRQFQPPFPTRLKIDVDGLEWQILQGARQTLCDPRLQSIMVELDHQRSDAERDRAIAWMSDAGLDLVQRGEIQESGR